ncbi:DUF490 domain-containing protein [Altericroceibacterium spongiae]|uniref:DUF490 domain-containing protein n=1 Tax=Altericroceibacterium spongiae TaxID=2320269 RepID=A0A420EMQ5_9SPHN|nr:translocation/assembly module TamB domain-containing protein [Altericroceibacterium spongiae]RKF21960.1 DUF490 domain-containing protein [Altericroceibacterium spongiae]
MSEGETPDMPDGEGAAEDEERVVATRRTNPLRTALRWSARFLVAIVGLLALFVLFLHTPPGRQFIVDQISGYAPASGLTVQVDEIDGSVLWSSTLKGVRFYDKNDELFLDIPEIELNWRPYKFPFTGLDVRHLILHDGTLYAAPELKPGDPEAPTLPSFDIRVDRLVVDNLHVAKELTGEERTVNLRAQTDIRDGLVYLKANGALGGGDRLNALIHAEPDGDIFKADVDIDAPAGGLIAELLGSEDGFNIDILGDGTWQRWDGAIVARQKDTNLLALRLYNRGGQYKLVGQIKPDRYLTGLPAQAMGDVISVAAIGTLKQSVVNGTFALRAAAVNVDADGAIDLNDNIFRSFTVDAALTDPSLIGQGMKLGDARISATLDGAFNNLSIAHQVQIGVVDLGGTGARNLAQQGTATYDGSNWVLPLDLQVDRVTTGVDAIDPRLIHGRVSGTVRLTGDQLSAEGLAIAFDNLRATLSVKGDIARSSYEVSGPVEARGFVLENVGTLDLGAKFRFRFNNGPWRLAANFNGRMPQITNDAVTTYVGTDIRFNGGVALGSSGPISVENFKLQSSKLQFNMNGELNDNTATLSGSGRHADYGPFTIEAEMADDGPHAVLVLEEPLPAAGLKDVRIGLAPIEQGYAIDTEGQSTLGPFEGVIELITPEEGPTRIEVDHFNIWKTSMTGGLRLEDGGVSGALNLSGGGLDGNISLAPRDGGQGIDVNLQARNAVFAGTTPLSIGRARVTADAWIGDSSTNISGSVRARGLGYGSIFIGSLAAQAKVRDGAGTFDAELTGRRGSRFELQLQGKVTPDQIVAAAKGAYGNKAIDMPRRAVLDKQEDGGWILRKTQLSFGDGFVITQGRFGGDKPMQVSVRLADLSLSLLDVAVSDVGLGGTISGLVEMTGRNGSPPTGNAKLMINNLTRSGLTLSSRPIDLALVMDLSPELLQTRAVINDGADTKGRLQGRIANLPAEGGLIERLQAGDLLAQLRYNGPAESLWRLAAIEVFDITGELKAAADIRGTLANPEVQGSLEGNNLHLTSALTGSDVRNMQARGTFRGSRLNLTRFSGTTPNDGTVTGSGFVDLSGMGDRGPKIDLRLSAKDADLLDREGMGATVTGPMRIVSDGVGGTIAGRLTINAANWALGGASAEGNLPDVKTREINIPSDIEPGSQISAPWRYMINAKADDNVEVRGMGLESEWRADIQLRGTTDDPRIGGSATVVPRQGFYSFASTRFELTRGQIDFDVNGPIDPRVDIVASADVADLDVTVKVTGNAMQPTISFESSPPLPEEEILARLLFGGSITDLSATDALQLGAALASLRGGGGMDPINSLRNAIGLDRLRIVPADPALDRETAVALGKNFGKRFYTEIITDGQGYNATELEFRVTSWLSLLGTVSSIGRESVSAEISKDY